MSGDIHDEEYVALRKGCVSFLNSTCEVLDIPNMEELCLPVLNKLKKKDIVKILMDSLDMLSNMTDSITDSKTGTSSMKTELIESQKSVIKLQSELLECKNDQINMLNVTVKTTVEDSVKAEFQTYSSVVSNNNAESSPMNQEVLKKAVQCAVQETDRSRNLIIFGAAEKPDEDLNATVTDIFEFIGEKPRTESCRLGRKNTDTTARPIKVTFSSSTIVEQILSKKSRLKSAEKFSMVFLSPDLTVEQRLEHKNLITELKQKIIDEPDKRHFVRGGKIQSVEKSKKL